MANQEQLEILEQGVEVWNKWLKENKFAEIDLSQADLFGANLIGANLGVANLRGLILAKPNSLELILLEHILVKPSQ